MKLEDRIIILTAFAIAIASVTILSIVEGVVATKSLGLVAIVGMLAGALAGVVRGR